MSSDGSSGAGHGELRPRPTLPPQIVPRGDEDSPGVVVCPQPEAAEAGARVLERGGNAIDAVVTTGFLQSVIDPPMAGLGGFGAMLYREAATGRTICLDFPSRAGGLTRPDQWAGLGREGHIDRFGYGVEGLLNDIGYQSVAVPGMVDGLGEAHSRWGSIPWSEALEPAVKAAADGFPISHSVHGFWMEPAIEGRASGYERMTATPTAAEIFAPGGELLKPGESCLQPDLARTLEMLAERGHREFYEGEIARAITADFAANGGHVTAEDLAGSRAEHREPLSSGYRWWQVLGAPPPCGGIMVGQMLRLLERYDLAGLGHNSAAAIALLVEAMKYGIHTRNEFGADVDFHEFDFDALLTPANADPFIETLARGESIEVAPLPAYESSDTTHVTVVDRAGNIVVLTHSLGYGSGVVTSGLGFLYNNYMNVFNPYPGHVDSIAPGKRRASSMAPTIVLDSRGEPVLAVGAPGATRIATAVLQSIVNPLDFGLSPVEAVAAPRADCQGEVIELEGRIPASTAAELTAMGYTVNRRLQNYDPYFARAQMIALVDGAWVGGSDPRRDGGTAIYEKVEGAK